MPNITAGTGSGLFSGYVGYASSAYAATVGEAGFGSCTGSDIESLTVASTVGYVVTLGNTSLTQIKVAGVTYTVSYVSDDGVYWTYVAFPAWSFTNGNVYSYQLPPFSTYTLVANAGTYALTGSAAALVRGRTLTAASGSYALTGQSASLNKGFGFLAASGAYSLTGAVASLITTRVLTAAAGSYSLTGAAAGLLKGRTFTADPGAYALTGTAAALRPARLLTAAAGSYALTGSSASLFKSYGMIAQAGAYSLTGSALNFKYNKLTAESGSYVLRGYPAALRRQWPFAPDAMPGSWMTTTDTHAAWSVIADTSPPQWVLEN